MTRLFIQFYLGVLIVLFLAWYLHSAVWKYRADAETARVFVAAHGGGARLVASGLDAAPHGSRDRILKGLRVHFDYPVEIISIADLPASVERQFARGDDVVYFRAAAGPCVVAVLSNGSEAVRLGPFPDYHLREIEESIGGWMRLVAEKLNSAAPDARPAVLEQLRGQFDFPIEISRRKGLPKKARERIDGSADVVFFPEDPPASDRWQAAIPLSDGSQVVRFGPFPSFTRIDQKAATTTLALVLLPVALAIALLLRPVARQLRHVENAAKAIASGNLTARVDSRRVRSAAPLAQAFNEMADRTETLVRTQRELLQAVSHELRTPLSRMRFAIDLIETAADDAERRQRLDSLDAATEELDELVGELLHYVRMETTVPQLNREQIAVRDIVTALIPKYAALYPAIEFSTGEDVAEHDVIITADRLGLERVLGNLLSNAGRFAKAKVMIHCAVTDGRATIDVDDDGRGIAAADRQRVFDTFVRLDQYGDGSGRGAGLGLALVKRIVTQHGGSVQVLTSPLGGCRMRTIWTGGQGVGDDVR